MVASQPNRLYPPGMDDHADPETLSFEQAMSELETIISDIDAGEIGLEEAMVRHRRGQLLIRRCRSILDAVSSELEQLPESGDAQTADAS